ncbi:MAG: tyrosine-type recombinase/integrase [Tagaea sp.]
MPVLTARVSPETAKQYRVAARKLQGIFAEFAPHDVQSRHVAQMRRGLAGTPNMANRCLTVLRLVFDYAVEEQLVDGNPCVGVKRLAETKRERLVELDEFNRIRAVAPPRLQCVMDLAYLTGQRIMDVVSLHRSAIRDEGIFFRQAKTDTRLIVRWTPELRAAVERAKALGGKVEGMTLFRTRDGTAPAYRTVRDQWVAACQKAGVADTTMRDLRAMAATHAKRQGIPATALLGHTSEAMTARYLRDREVPVVDGPRIGQSN